MAVHKKRVFKMMMPPSVVLAFFCFRSTPLCLQPDQRPKCKDCVLQKGGTHDPTGRKGDTVQLQKEGEKDRQREGGRERETLWEVISLPVLAMPDQPSGAATSLCPSVPRLSVVQLQAPGERKREEEE